jgi:hypothetical protein
MARKALVNLASDVFMIDNSAPVHPHLLATMSSPVEALVH